MSAHPSDGRPRGIQSVPDRARAASRMVDEGTMTIAEVAKLFGVKRATVHEWRKRVRDAEVDARNLERLGR